MRVQGFICTWNGHEEAAQDLEEKLRPLIDVKVINSEEHLEHRHPSWIHLDETAYFSAHWNKATSLFDADIFFQIQADAVFDEFEALISKAQSLFERYNLGVYEPNVNFTRLRYDPSFLRSLEPGLCEVPKTDSICWFIEKSTVHKLPPVDVTVNKYGFGIVSAIDALAQSCGKLCLRDYNFTVSHPKLRGYSTMLAKKQKEDYLRTIDPELRAGIIRVDEAFAARVRPKPRN